MMWNANAQTTFGLGAFSDRSGAAAPVAFPDFRVDYYGVSGGWKHHSSVRLSGESVATLQFSTTIAVRYAVGLGESTRIRFDFADTPSTGQVGRIATERVDVTYHEVSLYIGSGFEF